LLLGGACSGGAATRTRDAAATDAPVTASGGRPGNGTGGAGTGGVPTGGGGAVATGGAGAATGGTGTGGGEPGTGGAASGGRGGGGTGGAASGGRGGSGDSGTGGSAGSGSGTGGAAGNTSASGGRGGSASGGAAATGGVPGTGGASSSGGAPGPPLGINTECCHSDNVYACNNSAIRACTCAIDNTCCGVWLTDCAYNVERRKCGTCTAAPFTPEEGGYIRAAPWHGYAFVATESPSVGSIIQPTGFNAFKTGAPFCAVGMASGDPNMRGRAMMGFNLNQTPSGMPGGGAPWTPTGYGVYYNLAGQLNRAPLYIQLTAASGSPPQRWCARADERSGNRPWSSFGPCPGDTGTTYDGVAPLTSVAVVAQGGTQPGPIYDTYFEFCIANLAPY